MPTKIIVDLATGATTEVELEGAELEAYNASLAEQASNPSVVTAEPTLAEIVAQLQAEVAALKGQA